MIKYCDSALRSVGDEHRLAGEAEAPDRFLAGFGNHPLDEGLRCLVTHTGQNSGLSAITAYRLKKSGSRSTSGSGSPRLPKLSQVPRSTRIQASIARANSRSLTSGPSSFLRL